MDLTVHRCARGLCEERNKQEIDEVDEGEGIVPEQAGCRDTNRLNRLVKKDVTLHYETFLSK